MTTVTIAPIGRHAVVVGIFCILASRGVPDLSITNRKTRGALAASGFESDTHVAKAED